MGKHSVENRNAGDRGGSQTNRKEDTKKTAAGSPALHRRDRGGGAEDQASKIIGNRPGKTNKKIGKLMGEQNTVKHGNRGDGGGPGQGATQLSKKGTRRRKQSPYAIVDHWDRGRQGRSEDAKRESKKGGGVGKVNTLH